MIINFNSPYNRENFINFFKNQFLPEDFEEFNEPITFNFQSNHFKKVTKIGEVASLKLVVYEIEHPSENDPRVSLSKDSFRLLAEYGINKALIFFISGSSQNFRLSLVTIDLKWEEGKRIQKEYSNPRRYSFFLGPDAKKHTPEEYLINKGRVKDFVDLTKRFSIEVVTKEFFSELSNWYFWALKNIVCPKDAEKEPNGKKIFTIRFITRLIFIWFMKQKKLIPDYLFNKNELNKFLNNLSPKESTYYKAILQNLFFATLNTRIIDRKFRAQRQFKGINLDFMDHSFYRYEQYFNNPKDILSLFKGIPFLNGGLFECLDERVKENNKVEDTRIDGFSDRKDNLLHLPNFLFFSEEKEVDLNDDYGTKNKKYKVRGIINLLQTYNFTIDESTPVDVEIALDPELLGRVFENLLASYNPETATTARKATGSYYTPREIVDYMVTQSLKEYFKTKLSDVGAYCNTPLHNTKLNELLSYDSDENPFNENETDTLINAINNLKIIDPAVGSGAFPMGILQKLVLVLSKLDSHNKKWKQQQISAIEKNVSDVILKKELIEKVESNFQKNELDYGRKLYLIQNCIYGVDIQPIAIQIAKLRFFISLLVDEKINNEQENYGIEPLPNLELKFICANSLIGLKLQEKQTELDFKDPQLLKLEEDLKRVREIYFRTSAMNKKEKLRKVDKELRDKISLLLQKVYQPEDTKKISDWDPYNFNKSADWFDPEWMFGIRTSSPFSKEGQGGFDVVIANPPYVQIKQIPEEDKPYYIKNFKFATGRFNLFYFFIEITEKFTCKNGIVLYIVPDRLLLNTQCFDLRNWLLNQQTIIELDSFDESVFDSAVVDSIILFYKNCKNESSDIFAKSNVNVNEINSSDRIKIPISYFTNSPNNQFDLNYTIGKSNLIEKIRVNSKPLGKISDTRDGIIQSKIPDVLFLNKKENKFCQKLLFGKDIHKYHLKYDNNWVNYQPDEMMKIEIKRGGGGLRLRTKDIFEREKILTRQTADEIIGTLDSENYYYSNTLHGTAITNKDYDIKFVLALLNSKILTYYYRATTAEGGKVFAQMKIEILRQLPIKYLSNQQPFIDLVDKILTLTNPPRPEGTYPFAKGRIKEGDYLQNPEKQAKVKELEHQIDQLVYKLYDLTDEEIKIVEGT